MRDVYISGIGLIKVSEHWDKPLRILMAEAGLRAIEDSGGAKPDVVIISTACSEILQSQSNIAPLVLDEMGLTGTPALRIESGNASGALALHVGYNFITSGIYDKVLVIGGDKLSDLLPSTVESAMSSTEDREYVAYHGVTKAGLIALIYRVYMRKYSVKREDIASLAVHDHNMAVGVPHAQYPFKISLKSVLEAPTIADPITLFESFGLGDGAAAVLLSSTEYSDVRVKIRASEISTDTLYPGARDELTFFKSTSEATTRALKRAGIELKDIDVLEMSDAYTITGIIALESMGFAEKGMGPKLVVEGELEVGGKIPTNTFGGLKARGNPLGATGLYQIAELTLQLRGEAPHQVPKAEYALAHNSESMASISVVSIIERVR